MKATDWKILHNNDPTKIRSFDIALNWKFGGHREYHQVGGGKEIVFGWSLQWEDNEDELETVEIDV